MLDSTPSFTQADIDLLLVNIDHLDADELAELEGIVSDLAERQRLHTLRTDLLAFCQHMQSDYKIGAHHRKLAGLLEDIEARRKDRICVSVPPRHGKSQLVSIYYAAWYLGRNPSHKVMLVSHTTDLAVDFGRKVRNLINSDAFREVFPDVKLASDSKSAGRWNTDKGGEFFAAGVGSALAGRGAHLLLIDDPHSEQDVLNGNYGVFTKAYEWFVYGARTRLMPGGAVAVVHCMTGDTAVLMSDGTERALRDIRPGDMVASYDGAQLANKKVLNWANMGQDDTFDVVMEDGNVVSGNTRHPFLVVTGAGETWVKLGELKPGMRIRAFVPIAPSKNTHGYYANTTTIAPERVLGVKHSPPGRATGVYTEAKPVHSRTAPSGPVPAGCAPTTTTSKPTLSRGLKVRTTIVTPPETPTCGTVMVSDSSTTKHFSISKETGAPFVASAQIPPSDHGHGIETTRLPLTTATIPDGFADCSAMDATCSCATTGMQTPIAERQTTLRVVAEIRRRGREDVFDIEVEDTHNFVANGNVVSNTRWHQSDMIGRLIADMTANEGADQYEVFEFPAIMSVPVTDDDGHETIVEKALWPEFFDLPALRRTKASMPVFQWNAQYQQTPTAEEAAIIKREWWRSWTKDDPPTCEYVIMSLDAAAETNNRADFTSLTTWGVFKNEQENSHQIILLNAIKQRLEFPELKRMAMEEYKEWDPDAFIVEKKSAGTALYQEMRRAGIPVQEYTPHRGTGDKMARLNSVADIISAGMCWVPERRWAEEVVEEIAGFPFMANDDHVDTCIMALLRFRQGGFLRLPTDEDDDELPYRGKVDYY